MKRWPQILLIFGYTLFFYSKLPAQNLEVGQAPATNTPAKPVQVKPKPKLKPGPKPAAMQPGRDTLKFAASDSLKRSRAVSRDTRFMRIILATHPYFNFKDKPEPLLISKREKQQGREIYFYTLLGVLLLFAGFRTAFHRYFSGLFSLFFRTTAKQRQVRQQLMQDSLSSGIFNVFHAIISGFYLALLFMHVGALSMPFWNLLLYCITGVAAAYTVKFLSLKLMGWLFDVKPVTNEYIFVVFYINKIISLSLLPIVIVAALGNEQIRTAAYTISWIMLAGFLAYRVILSSGIMRKAVNINIMHFILYVLAFEIIPILVVFKVIWNLLK